MSMPLLCVAATTPEGAAEDTGNQALSKYGTAQGMNENMFKPMMSGSTPMTTLDDTQQFNASLLCPSSQQLLQVLVQPGPTGDLSTLIVSQDLDFNGSLDYTFMAPFPISGICSNGVIGCDPGTWNNCRAYRWIADASSQISLQETLNTNVGGCYCINSSCGSQLAFNNVALVLQTIGGGATAAVRTVDTGYVISGMTVDGTLATYYGQNAGQCQTINMGAAANYESYFYNPGSIQTAADSEIAVQRLDPNSLYSTMQNVLTNRSESLTSCAITRASVMGWNPAGDCEATDMITNGCSTLETDSGCRLKEEAIDGITTVTNFMFTGLSPQQSCIQLLNTMSASCDYGCPSEPEKPCLDVGGVPTCTLSDNTTQTCSLQVPLISASGSGSQGCGAWGSGSTLHIGCGGTITFNSGIQVWGSGGINLGNGTCFYGSGYSPGVDPNTGLAYDSRIDVRYNPWYGLEGTIYFKGAIVTGNNSMYTTAYAGSCGVSKVNNYQWEVSTQANCCGAGDINSITYYKCPIPGASACSGVPPYCQKTCSENVCRDWWKKDRTYVCASTSYDFSDIKKRAAIIKQSAAETTTSMYYQDYRKENGAWVAEDKTFDMTGSYRPTVAACAEACKTITPKEPTDTTMLDVRTNYLQNPSMYNVHYKTCAQTTGCPVEAGETVLKDCQCIQEFMEAALIMQIIRMAGKDLICSSGTKQPVLP